VRVPLRTHTFTGQVWVTKVGVKRFLIKQSDRIIALLSTFNIVDSPSQRQFLVNENVMRLSKSTVFAKGSISGVDIARFKPNQLKRIDVRQQLNISENAIIFLFVGRLTLDKGVLDLAHAFSQLSLGKAHLLFVGPDEGGMQVKIEHVTQGCSGYVHFVKHTDVPEYYMAAADVLFLPSYREGFGTVVIEAAAVGIPTIASRIYGISDAVVDGETGMMHEPRDINAIKNCMECLMNNEILRLSLGEKARARAIKDFDSKVITQDWLDFYHENIR
jgi:glycosyltransferase involved in cell wall biosynthesis